METKEIKITPPKGYIVDKENSTFDCIKFKLIERWRDSESEKIRGYYINSDSNIIGKVNSFNVKENYNTFATEKQAKSNLARARISQIMANDKRFGGAITDKDWGNTVIPKYIIREFSNELDTTTSFNIYYFLAFHTKYQRDLFLEENEDLIKDYLML